MHIMFVPLIRLVFIHQITNTNNLLNVASNHSVTILSPLHTTHVVICREYENYKVLAR
jgi:hypothetical protein